MLRKVPGRRPALPVWVGFWLSIVFVSTKAVSLGTPRDWDWLLSLARVSFQDVLFALAIAGAGEILLRMAAKRPRLARAVRGGLLGCGAVCALYAVVSYGIFNSFGRPLSYDLLLLMRNAAAAKSSIIDQITWPIGVALLGAPVSLLAAAWWGSGRRAIPPFIVGPMGIWIGLGLWEGQAVCLDKRMQRLALSPHFEILRTTLGGLANHRAYSLPRDFPPEDVAEFQLYGTRGAGPKVGFVLPPNTARPRNVIVVVLESVGTRYLSLYGSPYATTPNLVAESEHAIVFDHMYAHAPYTFCEFMAVNFSIYPGLPWCYAPADVMVPHGPRPLPPTMASILGQRGYRTAYLHNGDLDWGGESSMLEGTGYQTVQDYRHFDCPKITSWGAEDRYLFDHLIQWIDEKPGQPFLAYCWTDQTHNPYAQRPGTRRIDFFQETRPKAHAEALSRYLNVVHETDGHLERLFTALRERGLADDTLVVVTGDHGEAFADPHEQQGHGFTVYQEEVSVPFMIWNPRLFKEGRRVDTIGGHVDLNPTIADIMGLDIPDQWQGHSLFEGARPERTYFVASVDEYTFGMREDQWKYMFEATSGKETLFDLSRDPNEQSNALFAEPERARRLRQHLAAWIWFEDTFLGGRKADAAKQ